MKTSAYILIGLAMALGLPACQTSYTPLVLPATTTIISVETSTPPSTAAPAFSSTPAMLTPVVTGANPVPHETTDIVGLEASLGYRVREPTTMPQGYVLEKAVVDNATGSVCLQYRYPHEVVDNVLWLAQGPVELAPPLAQIPGWPEYAFLNESATIGGAENSSRISGWRRSAWACTAAAEAFNPQYSFAMAPQLTWQSGGRQFDLYAANGGCGTPGGMTALDLLRLAESLTGSSTHAMDELDPGCLHSQAEIEKLAGFAVILPAYLPEYASFYFATYQGAPEPLVIQRFLHKEHADMGTFFQISQQPEAPPFFSTSCEDASTNMCEILQIGSVSVVYHYSGEIGSGTEQLDWYLNGFYFSLFRNAGEPGKIYKDELVKIVASMQNE